ncbi:MAG TPA: heavy metal-responsive transcriptional regulator [Planctomycetes bacterium]|nr:heavy metal-responsive transcriptional regulator [Planctomycetota bacterium]
MTGLTRSELSHRTGVNPETLRYYERLGLLPPPPRSASNYRLYPEDAVVRLRFIRKARELGFTLREVGDLLALRTDSKARCSQVRKKAEQKLADVEEKVRSLRAIAKALKSLIQRCSEDGPTTRCPILEAMNDS